MRIKNYKFRNGEIPFSVTNIKGPDDVMALVSVDKLGPVRVHTEAGCYTGRHFGSYTRDFDLIEVKSYEDLEIDQPVVYGNYSYVYRGHFAGVDGEGKPMVFAGGRTKFSSEGEMYCWLLCRAYDPAIEDEVIE